MANRMPRDPYEDLSARIARLERMILDQNTKHLMVPILDADPTTDHSCNFWVYPDGRLIIRMKDGSLRQVSTTSASAASGSNPAASTQAMTRVGTWTATWAQAYGSGGAYTTGDNRKLYYGDSGTLDGQQASLIGFDYTDIQSDLSGALVSKVDLWLSNEQTWYGDGASGVWVGLHNNTVKPGTYSGTIGRDYVSSIITHPAAAEWHSLSTETGSRIRDNTAKGVLLNVQNEDPSHYGYAAGGPGTPDNQLPILRITYVK